MNERTTEIISLLEDTLEMQTATTGEVLGALALMAAARLARAPCAARREDGLAAFVACVTLEFKNLRGEEH